jgi:acetyltransferase-like isoleucine patch superfamily enzyme
MNEDFLQSLSMMGENLKSKLKYCGEGVFIYPLCKMIRPENAELDDHCRLFDNVFVDAGKSLKIGKYSTITWQCVIEGGASTTIGDRVFLGPGAKVLNSTYELNGYYSIEHIPNECRKSFLGDIVIKDDAYIGANSVIMPGVTIGEGAVVGANSLVNHNLKPWGIYFGNPV